MYQQSEKSLLNSNISSTCPHNMVNCGSVEVNQTLHDVWPSPGLVHYIYILGALAPNRILPGAKFTFRPSLAFSYIGSITAQHFSSGGQPDFAAWYKELNYGAAAPRHFQQRVPRIFQGQPSCWAQFLVPLQKYTFLPSFCTPLA